MNNPQFIHIKKDPHGFRAINLAHVLRIESFKPTEKDEFLDASDFSILIEMPDDYNQHFTFETEEDYNEAMEYILKYSKELKVKK